VRRGRVSPAKTHMRWESPSSVGSHEHRSGCFGKRLSPSMSPSRRQLRRSYIDAYKEAYTENLVAVNISPT